MNNQPMINCSFTENNTKKIYQLQGGMIFKFFKFKGDFIHTFFEDAFAGSEEMIGKKLSDLIKDAEEYEKMTEHYDKAWQGNVVTFERKTKNGVHCLTKLIPVKENGQVMEVIASCVDITKLKEAEQRMLYYQTLVENSPDVIVVHDGEKIVYINHAGVSLFGAGSKEELIGQSIWKFVHQDFHSIVKNRIHQVIEKRIKVNWLEEKFVRLDGKEIYVEVSGIPFSHNNEQKVQLLIRDVGNRKQVINHIELLKKSERLAVLGELAAGIAHEIRNPLTSLRGFTQLLQARLRGSNKEFCDIMISELDRINAIVGELLLIAKPKAEKFQNVNIEPLINQTVTLFQSQANLYNVQMIVHIDDNNPIVCGEANQLKQVFINLIKNAIEAMPNGGRLLIMLHRKDENKVAVTISDTGIGIPQNRLEKLGEPFYTTKETGTGLGLMICYKIIENHNGEIFVTSKVNQGTTIEIFLPVKDWQ